MADFFRKQDGIYYAVPPKTEGGKPQERFLCSIIEVVAKTRTADSENWGKLLQWQDADGKEHQWAMPAELLANDGAEVARVLVRGGLVLSPGRLARDRLTEYLQASNPEARAICTNSLGWNDGVYVMPEKTIGGNGRTVVYQATASAGDVVFSVAGSTQEWRENVAHQAAGNSRLVFAICAAFAGALLKWSGLDSGGFHLFGDSSSGKSTILQVAASVWGKPKDIIQTWYKTANGVEGVAASHNDNLLILDELSQADPKEAGKVAYMLANGGGKGRAGREGEARQVKKWVLLFLSAGEETLKDLLHKAGGRINAGQEVRLASIQVDAGEGYLAFESIYPFDEPAMYSEHMKNMAGKYYGAIGLEWLQRLAKQGNEVKPDNIREYIAQFVCEELPAGATGQARRVAERFGLVAFAGELASHYGLTGWGKGAARKAVAQCLKAWREDFGAEKLEDSAILASVKTFIGRNTALFKDLHLHSPLEPRDRVGFRRTVEDELYEYIVLPEQLDRVLEGANRKKAVKLLSEKGWLKTEEGKPQVRETLPGLGRVRAYVFKPCMWDE